jgi:TonB family protein
MSRSAARDSARDRLLRSLLLAVLLHAVALVALEVFLRLAPQKPPEYHGPIIVQLEEQPVVQQVRQATPRTAAPAAAAPGQAQAGAGAAAPAAAAAAPTVAAEPPLPSGPPLRTAAPAAEAAAAASGSPFRLEGSPAQAGPPRPAGEGFQVTSSEPTLPPAGQPAQGPPLRAVAPGESAAARPGGQTEAVMRQLDQALASGPRQGGAAGAQAGAAGPSGSGAQAAAQSGTGQGEASREGISIVFEKPDRGREPTFTPLPVIPKWVSDAGLRLTVGISFELTPQGVLDKVRITKNCGYSDVDWAVLVAVRRWKFKPAPASAGSVQGTVSYLILPH